MVWISSVRHLLSPRPDDPNQSFLRKLDFVLDMTHVGSMKIFALPLARNPQRLKIGG
jgi:hypothetical protein